MDRTLKNNSMATTAMNLAAFNLVPTPLERAAGRFMRAPDHGAEGEGGGGKPAGEGGEAKPAAVVTEAGQGGEGGGAGAGEGEGGSGAEGGAGKDQVTTSGAGGDQGAKPAGEGEGEGGEPSIAGGADKGDKVEVLGAPEAYDVKVPQALADKGMTFDTEVFGLVEPALRELNLSNSAAQALTNAYAEKVVPALVERGRVQAEQAQLTESARIRKEWADASRADTEIGGTKFDETVDACAEVWDKFGIKKGTGIRLLLDESGLGNHPDMLRFLTRVRTVTGEGSFVSSDGKGGDGRPIWDRVYGQPVQPEAARA